MKRCPSCQRIYADDAMSFCLEDGTPLEGLEETSSDPGATIKIPAARLTNQAPTEVMPEVTPAPTQRSPTPVAPPLDSAANAPTAGRKPNALPWILGAALVLGLSAIVVALIVTRGSGTNDSQVAQNTAQPESSAPSANASPVSEPGVEAKAEQAINPGVLPGPTPANEAANKTQPGKTPEPATPGSKPTPTPKPTPSPRPTPQPTPAATVVTRRSILP